jgi:hypothetical protein
MDIGILGVYILIVCGVSVMIAGLVYMVYYKVLQVTYWLLRNEIDWNVTNIVIVLWCLLVMVGVSLIMVDAIYIMWI